MAKRGRMKPAEVYKLVMEATGDAAVAEREWHEQVKLEVAKDT